MKKNNIINFPNKKRTALPSNMLKIKSQKTIRIPILEKIYEVDGELMSELKNDKTPRKLRDYNSDDFN